MQDVRSEAREDLNAAVVQTLSDSQADWVRPCKRKQSAPNGCSPAPAFACADSTNL